MQSVKSAKKKREAGFSLLELLVGITLMTIVMGVASSLLAGSFNIRTREDNKTDAIADVQRALNIMSREIGNSGFGLKTNGIVIADSNTSRIRVTANLNSYMGQTTSNSTSDQDEDVAYMVYAANGESYLIRYDVNVGGGDGTSILANRIDGMSFTYTDKNPTTGALTSGLSTPSADTVAVNITVSVTMPQVGMPNSPGFQPAWPVSLTSNVALRNPKK